MAENKGPTKGFFERMKDAAGEWAAKQAEKLILASNPNLKYNQNYQPQDTDAKIYARDIVRMNTPGSGLVHSKSHKLEELGKHKKPVFDALDLAMPSLSKDLERDRSKLYDGLDLDMPFLKNDKEKNPILEDEKTAEFDHFAEFLKSLEKLDELSKDNDKTSEELKDLSILEDISFDDTPKKSSEKNKKLTDDSEKKASKVTNKGGKKAAKASKLPIDKIENAAEIESPKAATSKEKMEENKRRKKNTGQSEA
ncbi:MAG: hypothetical protein J0H68_06885 [Sphingobacteriia bacterium]|nr:hypothetical protein [Sphingobacteriia bacterium]